MLDRTGTLGGIRNNGIDGFARTKGWRMLDIWQRLRNDAFTAALAKVPRWGRFWGCTDYKGLTSRPSQLEMSQVLVPSPHGPMRHYFQGWPIHPVDRPHHHLNRGLSRARFCQPRGALHSHPRTLRVSSRPGVLPSRHLGSDQLIQRAVQGSTIESSRHNYQTKKTPRASHTS